MLRQSWMPMTVLALVVAAPHAAAQEAALRDRIDAQVQAAWTRAKVAPVAPADDATFLRRVYLDLIGTIPTFEEAQAFLQSKSPERRAQLIDKLLDDPRYAVLYLTILSRPPRPVEQQRFVQH